MSLSRACGRMPGRFTEGSQTGMGTKNRRGVFPSALRFRRPFRVPTEASSSLRVPLPGGIPAPEAGPAAFRRAGRFPSRDIRGQTDSRRNGAGSAPARTTGGNAGPPAVAARLLRDGAACLRPDRASASPRRDAACHGGAPHRGGHAAAKVPGLQRHPAFLQAWPGPRVRRSPSGFLPLREAPSPRVSFPPSSAPLLPWDGTSPFPQGPAAGLRSADTPLSQGRLQSFS